MVSTTLLKKCNARKLSYKYVHHPTLFTIKSYLIETSDKTPRNGRGGKSWHRRPRPRQRPLPAGTTLFVVLRSLDFPLQLYHLRSSSKSAGASLFGLTQYYAYIAAMVFATSARHVFWQLYISEREMPLSFALFACTFNTVMNGLIECRHVIMGACVECAGERGGVMLGSVDEGTRAGDVLFGELCGDVRGPAEESV